MSSRLLESIETSEQNDSLNLSFADVTLTDQQKNRLAAMVNLSLSNQGHQSNKTVCKNIIAVNSPNGEGVENFLDHATGYLQQNFPAIPQLAGHEVGFMPLTGESLSLIGIENPPKHAIIMNYDFTGAIPQNSIKDPFFNTFNSFLNSLN